MRSRREIGWDLKKHNENTAKLQVRKFRRRPVYQDYRRFSMQTDMESAPTIFIDFQPQNGVQVCISLYKNALQSRMKWAFSRIVNFLCHISL